MNFHLVQHVVMFMVGTLKVLISDLPDNVKLQVNIKIFLD